MLYNLKGRRNLRSQADVPKSGLHFFNIILLSMSRSSILTTVLDNCRTASRHVESKLIFFGGGQREEEKVLLNCVIQLTFKHEHENVTSGQTKAMILF
jgi:hypothetical protein